MTAILISEMFNEYDRITREIATIEYQHATAPKYPSQVMGALTELHLAKWNVRRKINSAFTEFEQQKPLWKRIFKK